MAKILFLGNLGVVEIVLIALIVLLLFGGRKIPELMSKEAAPGGNASGTCGGNPEGEDSRGTEAEGVTAHRRNRHRRKNVPPVVSYAAHKDASRPVARERSGIYPSVDQRRRRPMDSGRKRHARFLPFSIPPPTPAIRSSTANELAAGTPHRKFRRFEKIVYLCVKHQMIR